ncbi:MAG: hypothetical protein HUK20_02575 [Fibrobacter sp.]|nr:hypothetical protein [Fibrobacter sp.]
MKPKMFIDKLPYGYTRLRNQNGSVALTLTTEGTNAFVFIKKVPEKNRMPVIDQGQIDYFQSNLDSGQIVADWYSDDNCRYFIIMNTENEMTHYHILLHAFFGHETFEVHGRFYENGKSGIRESVYKERYLKQRQSNELTTQTDFASEAYDIIFPDHPLSHCRRLANVVTMNADCDYQQSTEIKNKITDENV